MSQWSEKEIKLLTKLMKKKKPLKKIAEDFQKKGYSKNIFMIISKVRSMPELRPYYQQSELTFENMDKFLEQLKKRKQEI
jgi:ribosome-binding factor A